MDADRDPHPPDQGPAGLAGWPGQLGWYRPVPARPAKTGRYWPDPARLATGPKFEIQSAEIKISLGEIRFADCCQIRKS